MKPRVTQHPPSDPDPGPSIRTVPFASVTSGRAPARLTDRQREDLLRIATKLRLPARTIVYRGASEANSVYINGGSGVVKTIHELPSGRRRIAAFLFPRDLFGLAENGAYVNTAQTITATTLYRLPIDALTDLLTYDAKLQLVFLSKVTHALREHQRHALAVTRRDAAGRLAMFLTMLQKQIIDKTAEHDELPLPMSRADIAEFMGLTPEAVSRASAELERRGLVKFESRHRVRLLNARGLTRLAAAL
jgi:CRP/FNR family transcriptional regulator, anaerobic regulatory protein